MRKLLLLSLLIVTISQAGVTWFGYYEFEGDYASTPQQEIYFDYNKLRLDFDTNPSQNIHIGGDVVYKLYNGKTQLNIRNFVDPSFYANYPESTVDAMNFTFNDSLFIDNLFLDFHHRYFEIIVGKQQLPTGVGYAWNPSDIFNQKDIMDPTYEVTGVNALQLNLPVMSNLSLRGILQPDENFKTTNKYLEAKTWLPFTDLSLVFAQTNLKNLYGLNMEGDLAGIGVRTEFTVNDMENSQNPKYEYILGADYTFSNSLYILGEYLHNDFGAREEETRLPDYLSYFTWEQKSLNQNYLFLMAMFPFTELIDGAITTITNLDDESMVINPQLVYRIYQNVELTFIGNIFLGEDQDEFGYQNLSARLRLRAYF